MEGDDMDQDPSAGAEDAEMDNGGEQMNNNANPQNANPAEKSKYSDFLENLPNVFSANEDIVEKLRLLNYDDALAAPKKNDAFLGQNAANAASAKSLIPIHEYYFCVPQTKNTVQQFHTFVNLVSWILIDKLGMSSFEVPDMFDDPISISQNIVAAMKKCNIKADFPPQSLKKGFGDLVCYTLNSLLTVALQKKRFSISAPTFGDEQSFKEENNTLEDDDIEEIGETITVQQDDSEDDYYYGNNFGRETTEEGAQKKTIETNVAEKDWRNEVNLVGPKLIVRLQLDHRDWRTHIEQLEKNRAELTGALKDSISQLKKISEEIEKLNERITKREKMLSGDSTISNNLSLFQKTKQEFDNVTKKYKEIEEAMTKESAELNEISIELETVKAEIEEKNTKISDDSPLRTVTDSLTRLKNEIRAMDLQIGVLQNTLLQAKLKSKKRSSFENWSATSKNYDPFSI